MIAAGVLEWRCQGTRYIHIQKFYRDSGATYIYVFSIIYKLQINEQIEKKVVEMKILCLPGVMCSVLHVVKAQCAAHYTLCNAQTIRERTCT